MQLLWLSDVEARAETERDETRVSSVDLHDDDDDDDDAPARSNDMQALLVGVVGDDDDDDDNTVGHIVWSFLILEQRRVVFETNNLHNVLPVRTCNLCIPVVTVVVAVVVVASAPTVRPSRSFHIVNAVIAFCNNDALQLLTRYRCWWNRVVGRCRRSCRSS